MKLEMLDTCIKRNLSLEKNVDGSKNHSVKAEELVACTQMQITKF